MDYQKLYNTLISNAQQREETPDIFEIHHIIPKSLGGLDTPENLVKLTLREHFLAHLLLVKTTEGVNRSKMACAINRMVSSGKYTSRNYEYLRRIFIINHPSKGAGRKVFIDKLRSGMVSSFERRGYTKLFCNICNKKHKYSKTLTVYKCADCGRLEDMEYRASLPFCLCGCGERVNNHTHKWIKGHQTICACGCGGTKMVTQNLKDDELYLHGHLKMDDDRYKIVSATLKKTLAKISTLDMVRRMQHSAHTGDQKQRAESIRTSKASILYVESTDVNRRILSTELFEITGLKWEQMRYRVKRDNSNTIQYNGFRITILEKYKGGNKWRKK